MQGASRSALEGARQRLEPALRAAGADALQLGEQFFDVVAALDTSTPLCRALSDPSAPAEAKSALIDRLLAGKYDPAVVAALRDMATLRWSSYEDFSPAVEELGVEAVLVGAEARGALAQVEVELFDLARALQSQSEACAALSDRKVAPEQRARLLAAILGGRADPATALLARQSTVALRGRRFTPTLEHLGAFIAHRRGTRVAHVTSPIALTSEQVRRLEEILSRDYGVAIQAYVTVDPALLGGLRIRVGQEVIDDTVLSRLAEARRLMSGKENS